MCSPPGGDAGFGVLFPALLPPEPGDHHSPQQRLHGAVSSPPCPHRRGIGAEPTSLGQQTPVCCATAILCHRGRRLIHVFTARERLCCWLLLSRVKEAGPV